MDKQTAIEKLQHLASLKNKQVELSQFVNKECNRYIQEKINLVGKKVFFKQPDAPGVRHTYVDWTEYKPTFSEKHIGLYIGGLAALAFIGLIFLPIAFGWGAYWTVLIIGAAIVAFLIYSDYAKGIKEKAQNETLRQELINPFRRDIRNYEAEVNHGLQQLPEYKQFYQHAVETLLQYINEIEAKKYAAQKELEECNIELAKIDFIPCEYFGLAENILRLLESGRADTYKEALNMAIEEDRQEALERARREEENRRIAAMERQAEEARKQAEKMEADRAYAQYQADRERAAAEKAAKDHAAAAKQAADKAERERNLAGFRKCINCANNSKCSIYVQENGGGLTCGAYRPR